ncbi:uncharacterized protein LOC115623145 [Scaptodrosophila lebanonensis]|uniref:Uncharacterized protein LOC115623145 n=1 Tax=Drosophila lebanonensis TaxID=7225 RepID=A0A6J2TB04_DROLE|nr:uncharacterized protein LOC115623145 [Scaptodrosophila lebanonensis]
MFRRSHAEVLDQFLNILQHLPNLKRLSIMADFYSIREKLPLFTKLEELYLDVGLEAEELISCCKFNPNLRVLHIYNSNIYGNLLDIAKYCNTLEELWIQTKPNAEEYGPCAELPKLKSLIICGPHEAGTLHRPFHAMAKPMGDFNLHHLSIRNTIINFKETTKMSQIKSLVSLSCTFADALCVERLTLLKNLKELNILMKNDIQISRELLSIIRDCTKLEFLATERRNVSQNFLAEAHEVLRLIRNPDQDQPLKMLLIGYGRVSPVDRINDAYLQVL